MSPSVLRLVGLFARSWFTGTVAILCVALGAACGGGGGGSDGGDGEDTPLGNLDPVDPGLPPTPLADGYQPGTGVTWQWQLLGALNSSYSVDLYDVDLFETSEVQIQGLHGASRRVICYFSAGSWENWRPDKGDFPSTTLGATLDGWPDERWVDIRAPEVLAVMGARLDLAVSKGCDGVEADNVDGYANDNGLGLSWDDQLRFNRTLANAAHERGLSIALKNDLEQIPALVEYFDFAVNEQCNEYDECDQLQPFQAAGKAILNAEYAAGYYPPSAAFDQLCARSAGFGLSTLVLPLDLDDSFRHSCN